jgi:hypothetical protein
MESTIETGNNVDPTVFHIIVAWAVVNRIEREEQ